MELEIVWRDCFSKVYGKCSAMTEEQFVELVKAQARRLGLEIPECITDTCVGVQSMLYSIDDIRAEAITPLSASGITIEDYWVIDFEDCEFF